MTKCLFSILLSCIALLGTAMPLFASPAHPNGPEERTFTERTIRILGKKEDIVLTFAYPQPDDVVDWTQGGSYNASTPFPFPLALRFEYKGYFWQGVFGTVGFDVKINRRKPDSYNKGQQETMPWRDIDALLQGIRAQAIAHNQATKNERLENRQEWMEPYLSQLNGIPCIQQYVQLGNHPKERTHYYFPFEEDHALEVIIRLVDNSDRPGLTNSDWRPRAEAFANRLLSTVKVSVKPKDSQK
jgi:hypothetical protein